MGSSTTAEHSLPNNDSNLTDAETGLRKYLNIQHFLLTSDLLSSLSKTVMSPMSCVQSSLSIPLYLFWVFSSSSVYWYMLVF